MTPGIFTTKHLLAVIFPLLAFIISPGCAATGQDSTAELMKNNRAEQSLSFYIAEEGKDTRWDVNFKDGEISSVYKDGERIPDDEIDNHRDMIYEKLNKLQDKSHHITIDLNGFKSDMKNFKGDMKKLKDKKIEINFDKEAFKDGMKELKIELNKLKDKKIRIDFDSDKFKDEMKNLMKDVNVNVDINMDDLKENLKEMCDEMKNHHDELNNIDIDLSGLDEAMSNLGKKMGHIKENLHGIDKKLEKLNGFIDDLKQEMIKDNLLNNENDKLNVMIEKDGMKVNGKEIPRELFEKYKKMYEDHFGKSISDENRFRIVE
jgi:chromosome segregation ATPase